MAVLGGVQEHTAGLTLFERTQAAQLILSRVCEAYGRMLLLQGLFQADCHPGNILVMKGDHVSVPVAVMRLVMLVNLATPLVAVWIDLW